MSSPPALYDPIDLARARVLISNDDGIDAPGLKVLEKAVRALAREVWVVAPDAEQSAASHSLTMRRPLYARAAGRRRWSVDGTPTDCVLIAIHKLLKGKPPDLVLSGVNRGGNMGEDAIYSGTIAAAVEGALLGFPSIAFSQAYVNGHETAWPTAQVWAARVLAALDGKAWPRGVLLNINFPAVAADQVRGVEITAQGRHKIGGSMVEGVDPRGQPYFWMRGERDQDPGIAGSDLEAVNRGCVSVTPLCLDMTHRPTMDLLVDAFR